MKFCIFSEVDISPIEPQEDGKRAFAKMHVCYYCTKHLHYTIGSHLRSCHSSEEEVKEAFWQTNERERKHWTGKMKKHGEL